MPLCVENYDQLLIDFEALKKARDQTKQTVSLSDALLLLLRPRMSALRAGGCRGCGCFCKCCRGRVRAYYGTVSGTRKLGTLGFFVAFRVPLSVFNPFSHCCAAPATAGDIDDASSR